MRKIFIIAAIVFQIVVLAYMAGEREYIVRTGKIIYLRTAPIDPRDLFRGDYVRLDYDISTISLSHLKGDIKNHLHDKGRKVYTVLNQKSGDVAELLYTTDEKPDHGLFIKGRMTKHWRFTWSERAIRVKYGIEAYFVQQGKGLEMERQMGRRNEIQTPFEIQIALGSNGTGIITGHRRTSLGIGIEIIESPVRNAQTGRKSIKLRLTLMNVSDAPLALINLPDYRSFSLESVQWAKKNRVLAVDLPDPPVPTNDDVIVLQPGQKKYFDFDFSDSRWYIKDNGKHREIGTLEWHDMFRLIYRPPNETICQHLDNKEIIWHGYLPSRAFHGGGNID